MNGRALRSIRRDVSFLTSITLLALVGLSVLTGMGMDEGEGLLLMDDDVHAAVGFAMAIVAGVHTLLYLGTMRTYLRQRLRAMAGVGPTPSPNARPTRDAVE
jgi:hypothetical protein